MATNDDPPAPERGHTDESLRSERRKADRALAATRTGTENDADKIVQHAREHEDKTLEAARVESDQRLQEAGASPNVRATADGERVTEDRALASERRTEDVQLDSARERRRSTLAKLIQFEREETDERLLVERARSDEALAKRDDFLGMVSHDLRTILGGIGLSATQLVRSAADDEAGRATLKTAQGIQRSSARMNRLIGDLLDVSSIELGRLAVTPTPHDAVKLMEDAAEAFLPSATAKKMTLVSENAPGPLLADFDEERVLQVLGNLLSNAIKFTPAGGQIRLRVEPLGAQLRFSVSDSGVGIATELSEAVFERFWQVTPNDRRGLGLGLFISRCIVEAHGGKIWVESVLGTGSTFFFTLAAG